MKRRIVHQLACLAGIGAEKSPYEKDLCAELHTDSTSLKNQALEALHELLCDFSNFHISTIDSFFQTAPAHFPAKPKSPETMKSSFATIT